MGDKSENRWAAKFDPRRPITPLNNRYGMPWPPSVGCAFCEDDELAWMFPVGDGVMWPRRVTPDGPLQLVDNTAQQYYACARCAEHAANSEWQELAEALGLDVVPAHWLEWARNRSASPGFPWGKDRLAGWTPYRTRTTAPN